MNHEPVISADIAAINRIVAMPKILEVVSRISGMRFAAVARVTDIEWTVCAVRDEIDFGLEVGGQLELRSTICNEIRQHHRPVVFTHASAHPHFSSHHTPQHYGIESYISVPIFRPSGEFFGTLCAIDPKPQDFDESNLVLILETFAELIGAQLGDRAKLELRDAALKETMTNIATREKNLRNSFQAMREPIQSIILETHELKGGAPPGSASHANAKAVEKNAWMLADQLEKLIASPHARLSSAGAPAITSPAALSQEIASVVSEVRRDNPRQVIVSNIEITDEVQCDVQRIGEMMMQLINCVMKTLDEERQITIAARTDGKSLIVQIACDADERVSSGALHEAQEVMESTMQDAWEILIAQELAWTQGGEVRVVKHARSERLAFSMPLSPKLVIHPVST